MSSSGALEGQGEAPETHRIYVAVEVRIIKAMHMEKTIKGITIEEIVNEALLDRYKKSPNRKDRQKERLEPNNSSSEY